MRTVKRINLMWGCKTLSCIAKITFEFLQEAFMDKPENKSNLLHSIQSYFQYSYLFNVNNHKAKTCKIQMRLGK